MSSILMSAGLGCRGQKRMPEKVVMEPWEAILPKNHAGYTWHNSPSLMCSRRAQEPPLPGRPKRGVSGGVAGQGSYSVAVAGTALSTSGVVVFAQPAPGPP